MGQNYGPRTVLGGLSLLLDASDKKSYSGSGSVWYDVSGFGNHCSLPNTPGHYGSYFSFNGTSNYGIITSNSGSLNFSEEQTIIIVMRHTYTSGRRNPWNQAYGGYGTWTHEQGENITYFFGDSGVDNVPYSAISSATTSRGVWNVMCSTRDTSFCRWYKNGVLTGTVSNPYGGVPYTTTGITIGNGYAGYWEGDIACILAYQVSLSQGQVLENFNTLRRRFGL